MTRLVVLAGLAVLAGCVQAPPPPKPDVHYVVGAPYRDGAVWVYPRAEFTADQTGLAAIAPDRVGLTQDGEVFDQMAMAAGHRSLQLPAIVRVTNLENGRQVLVRLNDRGPASPARVLALTRRAAELLQAQDGTRIRLQVQEAESRQLAAGLEALAPQPVLTAVPVGSVASEVLAPPPGVSAGAGRSAQAGPVAVAAAGPAEEIPLRLPEAIVQGAADPGQLYIACGSFTRVEYARILAARLSGLGASVAAVSVGPRARVYNVRLGPFANMGDAEAMLDRALGAGVNDAAIVVQ